MEALQPDSRTAIVTLTHDPKLDDPALEVALKSEAFYITCLGSRRTHAKRVERLKGMGFDDAAIGRIHAPAGTRYRRRLSGRDRHLHPGRTHRRSARQADRGGGGIAVPTDVRLEAARP
ncbi:MAG: XdhC family protein [Thalassobaculum sp.]